MSAEALEFLKKREAKWLEFKQRKAQEVKNDESKEEIKIKYNGQELTGIKGKTTPFEIMKSQGVKSIVAKVNGQMWDLHRPLEADTELFLYDFESKEGSEVFWHSSAHILGQAIELLFKDAKLCIGPPLDEGGFYYDVYLKDRTISPDDYDAISKTVDKIISEKQPFERMALTKEEALELFGDNKFKVEIITQKVPEGETITAYRCGPLIDLCRGPHLPTTGYVTAMAVTKHSSSYWMGRADNDSLQRVYGISFPTKAKLKEYQEFLKLAEERDHRKLGVQQKLFFFHDLSPGSCFFLPHGARIYNTLMSFIRSEYNKRGYQEVISPNIFDVGLWKISGHYDNYKEDMFLFESEKQEFGLKPMNCPGHCLMFASAQHSYRELPIRYADFGVLHRNEKSGALSGLTRVRRFQQDDAHIFATHDQIEAEIDGVLDFIKTVYDVFGFKYHLALSTRPEKFLGEVATWDKAEAALSRSLEKHFGKQWTINAGDGAFYGPKIDIRIEDALRRKHQCATIQLDFQLPQRFHLQYRDSNSEFQTPVMIHRAVLGSVERMFAILLENCNGKWPFWLSPRQAVVVPVMEAYFDYAQQVQQAFHKGGFFVDVDLSNKQFNKKVFEARAEGYNYVIVVGERESKEGTVTLRSNRHAEGQEGHLQTVKLEEGIRYFEKLRDTKQKDPEQPVTTKDKPQTAKAQKQKQQQQSKGKAEKPAAASSSSLSSSSAEQQ